jgi:hypothetical protein
MAIEWNQAQYVSPNIKIQNEEVPLEAIQHSGDILQKRYDQNLADKTKMDILYGNIKSLKGDDPIVKQKLGEYSNQIKGVVDKGDYENATVLMHHLAGQYATDQDIQNTQKSYENLQAKKAMEAKLTAEGKKSYDFGKGEENIHQTVKYDADGNKFYDVYAPKVEERINHEKEMQSLVEKIAVNGWESGLSELNMKDPLLKKAFLQSVSDRHVDASNRERVAKELLPIYLSTDSGTQLKKAIEAGLESKREIGIETDNHGRAKKIPIHTAEDEIQQRLYDISSPQQFRITDNKITSSGLTNGGGQGETEVNKGWNPVQTHTTGDVDAVTNNFTKLKSVLPMDATGHVIQNIMELPEVKNKLAEYDRLSHNSNDNIVQRAIVDKDKYLNELKTKDISEFRPGWNDLRIKYGNIYNRMRQQGATDAQFIEAAQKAESDAVSHEKTLYDHNSREAAEEQDKGVMREMAYSHLKHGNEFIKLDVEGKETGQRANKNDLMEQKDGTWQLKTGGTRINPYEGRIEIQDGSNRYAADPDLLTQKVKENLSFMKDINHKYVDFSDAGSGRVKGKTPITHTADGMRLPSGVYEIATFRDVYENGELHKVIDISYEQDVKGKAPKILARQENVTIEEINKQYMDEIHKTYNPLSKGLKEVK